MKILDCLKFFGEESTSYFFLKFFGEEMMDFLSEIASPIYYWWSPKKKLSSPGSPTGKESYFFWKISYRNFRRGNRKLFFSVRNPCQGSRRGNRKLFFSVRNPCQRSRRGSRKLFFFLLISSPRSLRETRKLFFFKIFGVRSFGVREKTGGRASTSVIRLAPPAKTQENFFD